MDIFYELECLDDFHNQPKDEAGELLTFILYLVSSIVIVLTFFLIPLKILQALSKQQSPMRMEIWINKGWKQR